ncbi:G-type lectin S-receptor-like serine/threonine-protein kinase At4g27290 [Diospyros lotus]|uniref:G-type lectin S-receptor-like serine/threonine-protein kinase At4g27290 n=1 Tax=Diospyros lotus TaxID=55363 RepID=UPI00225A5E31|nr:G-type lectin S-receptor-like serine/threonine-protein kinase At4g27290 [Diospyros lotus]
MYNLASMGSWRLNSCQEGKIKDGETIVSSNGTFELGFFSPGNSKKRYVGMWYKEMSTTVVWVANRETPLADTSGVLKVIDPGILVLVNGSSSIIWSTNASISAQNPVAQLLESGNLVVKDVNGSNSEQILWQSFDYPGDTLLAGMKLRKNWVTGKQWYLSSWRSTDDPAPGDYTYSLDINGYPQIFLYEGSTKVFCSEPWNGVRFSGPHLRPNSIYKYGVVFEKDEIYYRYDLLDSSVVSRFILAPNGIGQRWTWVNKTIGWVLYLTVTTDNCDDYGLCGSYGTCNVNKSPVCGCLSKFVSKNPRDCVEVRFF